MIATLELSDLGSETVYYSLIHAHTYFFQEILEKRRQLVVQFENYREKKEEEFAHYKDRRLALRGGMYTV